MLSERSVLLSGYSNAIDSTKQQQLQPCDSSSGITPSTTAKAIVTATTKINTTAAAAAAYLYLEKVKNERMSPRMTTAQLDSLKDAIMESSAAAAVVAAATFANNNNNNNNNNYNNNCLLNNNSSENNNNTNRNNINNNSGGSPRQSLNVNNNFISNNSLVIAHQQHQQQQQSIHISNHNCNNNNNNNNNNINNHHHVNNKLKINDDSRHTSSSSAVVSQLLNTHTTNHVKKERLSPVTNSDLHSTISRSRSTTPSSFRGNSPQQSIHSSPSETIMPMHNLSTNLLNTIQQAAATAARHNAAATATGPSSLPGSVIGLNTIVTPTLGADFTTCNYSDFMRSLAAKYNNANPNEPSLRRKSFFDTPSSSTASTAIITKKTPKDAIQKSNPYYTACTTVFNKEVTITPSLPPPPPLSTSVMAPNEATATTTSASLKTIQQQNQIAAAADSNSVSPFMTSLLSTLPFAQSVYPPLIDMSSTQALITLARVVKETEIQNVLRVVQPTKRTSATASPPTPHPHNLSVAMQQAAQFISPTLIYSTQMQSQQQHPQQLTASRQSSPAHSRSDLETISNVGTKSSRTLKTSVGSSKRNRSPVNSTPLDLSSQPPPSKRFKAELNAAQTTIQNDTLNNNNNNRNTIIQRRVSSSSATAKSLSATWPSSTDKLTTNEATTTTLTTSATTKHTQIPMINAMRKCQAQSEEVNSWTVDDVCNFVGNIDICAEYVKHFRDQCIDGSGLPLLTEDHLVNSLGMKLGPALKLRSVLAKKWGGPCPCVTCVAQAQHVLTLQATSSGGGGGSSLTSASCSKSTIISGSGGALASTSITTAPINSTPAACNSSHQRALANLTTSAASVTVVGNNFVNNATTTIANNNNNNNNSEQCIGNNHSGNHGNNGNRNGSESYTNANINNNNNNNTNNNNNDNMNALSICGNDENIISDVCGRSSISSIYSNNAKDNNDSNVNIGNFSRDHSNNNNNNNTNRSSSFIAAANIITTGSNGSSNNKNSLIERHDNNTVNADSSS